MTEYGHPGEDGVTRTHPRRTGATALIPSVIVGIATSAPSGGVSLTLEVHISTRLGYQMPTTKAAFGRGSFWSSIALSTSPMLLVLDAFIFAGRTEGNAEVAGAMVGGTVLVVDAFVTGVPPGIGFSLPSRRYQTEDSGQSV